MYRRSITSISFFLILIFVGGAYAELVGHWRFDGNLDDSVGGADGTFSGGSPTYVKGRIGQGIEFDGVSQFVHLPSENPSAYTITLWVKPARTDAASVIVRTSSSGQTTHWSHQLRINPQGVFHHYLWVGSERNIAGTTLVEAEEWYHVAIAAATNGTMHLYVNGEEDAAPIDVAGTLWGDGDRYYVGSNSGHGMGWFQGVVDDVQIYDNILTAEEVARIAVASGGFPLAFKPSPKDGMLLEDTWVSMSWRAGDFAASHDVYIGDDFDDVNSGVESTFQGNQNDTFFVVGFPGFPCPDGLVPGTTYYWRIDEVNDAEPNSPWKGDVWSFSIPPKTAYFPDPADGAEAVDVDVRLSWTGGFGSKLHTVYFGETFEEVNNATGGQAQGSITFAPGTLKMAKTYYWRVDEFDVIETHKGNVWSFTTEGAVANPSPAKGAVDVTQTPTLIWTPGVFGASHEVYFGADASSLELKSTGNRGSESFEPGQLEWDTTYYWRVDEANNANADSPWTGPLWSFTTANFLIIDDFESYNDINEGELGSNRIYLAWIDGFDNPAINGSVVGHPNPPFAEQTIVHGGSQSMPMSYDNAVGKSEATLTLTSNRDWTVNGVNRLTIWFRGSSSNAAEQLYVTLNGNARVDHDNPDAARVTSWTEWSIPLQAFADQGVNLSNVNSITLGLRSVTGGTGIMYFDDIRLYAPAP
jgi:hypothetical protein